MTEPVTVLRNGTEFTFRFFQEGDYLHESAKTHHVFYEEKVLDAILAKNPQGHVFMDLGAHVGNHAIFMAAYCNCSCVIAVEPQPDAFECLRANVLANTALCKPIICINAAASDGKRPLYLGQHHPTNAGGTRMFPLDQGKGAAHVITVDSLGLTELAMLKIDVETMEPQVLEGAQETLARCKPLICIEILPHHNHPKHKDVVPWMAPHGYKQIVNVQRCNTYLFEASR